MDKNKYSGIAFHLRFSILKPAVRAAALAAAVVILALGFVKNRWGVADRQWFERHQLDSESLVLGRLQKTRQDGLFAAGGLPGRAVPAETDNIHLYQYHLYRLNLPVREFQTYDSQSGGQAMLFSLIERCTGLSNAENLDFLRGLTSALTATALAIIIFWFYGQFGILAGIMVFISALLSQWLVVFGRNLFWVIWVFYLPMLAGLGILSAANQTGRYSNPRAGSLLFAAVLIKCLFTGCEYITTVLLMMVTPYVYYGISEQWGIKKLLVRMAAALAGGLAAVLAGLAVLACQVAAVRGGLIFGLRHILYSFGKRSYGAPDQYPAVYKASLEADLFPVLALYFKGIWCDLSNVLRVDAPAALQVGWKLSYGQIILLFVVVSGIGGGLLCSRTAAIRKRRNQLLGLIGATWFALLASLSWFVVFKAHSYIHTHMNFIAWHMPFVLFGFALAGYVAGLLLVLGRNVLQPGGRERDAAAFPAPVQPSNLEERTP